jgi:tRNA A-37 threonylcarbamoyl transferase component Bud32
VSRKHPLGQALSGLGRVIDVVLLVVVIALGARFALQFPHPPWVDATPAVTTLKRAIDPALMFLSTVAGLGSVRAVGWPSPRLSYLPLLAAVVIWIARASIWSAIDTTVRRLNRPVESPRAPEPRAEPAPPPVPAVQAAAPPAAVVAPAPAAPAPAPAARIAPAPESTSSTVLGSGPTPLDATPTPATRANMIGRYEVLGELGRGAMGVVYKARDPRINRIVAIKTILAANLSAESIEKYKRRFMIEAQAAGKLVHPGIVAVHDVAEDAAGQPCLVIEFVQGIGMDRWMADERPSVDESLRVLIEIARALDHAHAHGVVHRDVKPANILITSSGQPKVSDFGIAKLSGVNLTSTGQLVGTPAFMSPEQFTGAPVDARSDIFSLGAMAYLMLTGERAFPAETVTALSFKVVHVEPIPARQMNPALPEAVERIVSRCLAKSPEQRYQSCGELAEDLRAARTGLQKAAS